MYNQYKKKGIKEIVTRGKSRIKVNLENYSPNTGMREK